MHWLGGINISGNATVALDNIIVTENTAIGVTDGVLVPIMINDLDVMT